MAIRSDGGVVVRLILFSVAAAAACGVSLYHRASPRHMADNCMRVVANVALGNLHASDADDVRALAQSYVVNPSDGEPEATFKALEARVPGFRYVGGRVDGAQKNIPPFVYEDPDAEVLKRFRETYELDRVIAGAANEYDAQIKLAHWVGTQFDHGMDPVPGGNHGFDPSEVIRTGREGSRYWCEIAAKTMVYAATSLGWPARLGTGSIDGFVWEHALAEIWSNVHEKWVLFDTDYNYVFEHNDVPLSLFELAHSAPGLESRGELETRHIAPKKEGINWEWDTIQYYRYVHIDMRNDWLTRSLSRGSPAGGDYATWWTARPEFRPHITVRRRVDDMGELNWPVNGVSIRAVEAAAQDGSLSLVLSLSAYCPYFEAFLLSVDGSAWQEVEGRHEQLFAPGAHHVRARVRTRGGHLGPVHDVRFEYSP